MNILVTDGTSFKTTVIARYLKENYPYIKVMSITGKRLGKVFHSKYIDSLVHSPFDHEDAPHSYIAWLQGVIRQNKINLLIPVNSREIGFLIKNKSEIAPVLDYMGSYDDYNTLNNKMNFIKLCGDLNINCPRTYTPDQIDKLKGDTRYVLKPIKSSGAKGVKYFNDKEKLIEFCARHKIAEGYQIQEYFDGIGGGISFFARNGNIVEWYAHSRLLEFPVNGGSSTMRKCLNFSKIDDIAGDAEKIARAVRWSGFCMLELKYNENDYVFIEANPRIWGSINQGLVSGVNYFEPLLGKSVKKNEKTDNITINSPLYLFSFIGEVMIGKARISRFLDLRKKAIPDISLFDDPFAYIGQFIR